MNAKQIDLLNALNLIKNICESNTECDNCPLYVCNVCVLLSYPPDSWELNDGSEVWRAFK